MLGLELRSVDFGENGMRHIAAIIATVFFFAASAASAQITWIVDGRTTHGSPLQAVSFGTIIVLDITLRSSAPVSGPRSSAMTGAGCP